jgi:hypothetical protein
MKTLLSKLSHIETILWFILFALIILIVSGCSAPGHISEPFAGHTNNKPLSGRMTHQQHRNLILTGKAYTRINGECYKVNNKISGYLIRNEK